MDKISSIKIKRIKTPLVFPEGIVWNNFFPEVKYSFVFPTTRRTKWFLLLYSFYKYFTLTRRKVKGTYYIIHNFWSRGYHHWIMEALLKFLKIEEYKKENKININGLLIPEDYPKFSFEILDILGIKYVKYKRSEAVVPEVLLLPSNPPSGYFENREYEILKLKNFLVENFVDRSSNKFYKYVYISRRNASLRRIVNEEEIIKELERLGFEILFPETLSIKAQANIFYNTEVLVSIHGAGLTNMIYMPSGSYVFEIFRHPYPKDINRVYQRLANVLGINHKYIFSDIYNYNSNIHIDRQDLYVDVKKLLKEVSEVLYRKV